MSTVNGQVTDSVSNKVVPAMDKLIDKISPAIAALSDKLGTTAEKLFGILVKQSYNYALGNVIIIIFAFISLYVVFYSANIWKKKIKEDGWNKQGWEGIIAIKIVGLVSAIIVITTNTTILAQRLINPEFYALQSIMQYIN